jgi:hypothetical protein
MNVRRTFNIPAADVALAQKVADALQNGHQGMFRSFFKAGAELGQQGDTPAIYVSTGVIDSESPMLNGTAALTAALEGTSVTTQEIADFAAILDYSEADALSRAAELDAELNATVSAADWVQPTGASDAYPKDALVKYDGKTWKSLQDANVFQPGVASWRETWGTATNTPPDWVQPVGAVDAYPLGARITHLGDIWVSTLPANVWEPGVTGWTQETPTGPTVEPWVQGGGTGTAGSYNLNDEVTHTNAQDSNNVWLFRSKIAANTTEPGTDGTFHRWWEPVEAI